MRVKIRKITAKRKPTPAEAEQVSKRNYSFLENDGKTISTTNIVRYENAFDLYYPLLQIGYKNDIM